MSFSTQTKNELARIQPKTRVGKLAELSALVRMSGTIKLMGFNKLGFTITTENPAIARKIFKLLKEIFDITTQIMVKKNKNLKKNNNYILEVAHSDGGTEILREIGILREKDGIMYISNEIPNELLKGENEKRAYIRGAFLGGGSISDPEKTYHMEFVTEDEELSQSLKELINSYEFNSKIVIRKNSYVIYLKESENISDILNLMGGHLALLNLENIKIYKQMRNDVNRIVNCETANLSKTVNAAMRQIENIQFIKDTVGLNILPDNLKEVAELRIQYEDLSLKELGEMMNTKIGKSGVNHRLRKIEKIAEELKERRKGKS